MSGNTNQNQTGFGGNNNFNQTVGGSSSSNAAPAAPTTTSSSTAAVTKVPTHLLTHPSNAIPFPCPSGFVRVTATVARIFQRIFGPLEFVTDDLEFGEHTNIALDSCFKETSGWGKCDKLYASYSEDRMVAVESWGREAGVSDSRTIEAPGFGASAVASTSSINSKTRTGPPLPAIKPKGSSSATTGSGKASASMKSVKAVVVAKAAIASSAARKISSASSSSSASAVASSGSGVGSVAVKAPSNSASPRRGLRTGFMTERDCSDLSKYQSDRTENLVLETMKRNAEAGFVVNTDTGVSEAVKSPRATDVNPDGTAKKKKPDGHSFFEATFGRRATAITNNAMVKAGHVPPGGPGGGSSSSSGGKGGAPGLLGPTNLFGGGGPGSATGKGGSLGAAPGSSTLPGAGASEILRQDESEAQSHMQLTSNSAHNSRNNWELPPTEGTAVRSSAMLREEAERRAREEAVAPLRERL